MRIPKHIHLDGSQTSIKSSEVQKALEKVSSAKKSQASARFFKTGKGQYGQGDVFIGVTVPEQRKIAKKFAEMSLVEVQKLLQSKVHEHRFTALEILVRKYELAEDFKEKKQIVDFYLEKLKGVNNWDLVDTSAYCLLGDWLSDKKDRSILDKLSDSKNMWENRIAVVSTFAFIKKDDFKDILRLSEKFLEHSHDLMHKACGWMLREVGKRDVKTLELFLEKHYKKMHRTMLRYAIERFPEAKRQKYLKGKI